jgi:hypothetical protein
MGGGNGRAGGARFSAAMARAVVRGDGEAERSCYVGRVRVWVRTRGGAAWHGTATAADAATGGGGSDVENTSSKRHCCCSEGASFRGVSGEVDAAACSPTNQARLGSFAHQRQRRGIPRASRHNMVLRNSGSAMVGVQQRCNASQGHSARLRGADWGEGAEELPELRRVLELVLELSEGP